MANADPRPRYRLIVFDWDGTLADSTSIIARAIQRACADLGEPVPDDTAARYVIGLGLADALAHVAPRLARHRHPELSERYRHHYLARDREIALFNGARELLVELKAQGRMLAVATGKSRAGLDRVLQNCALHDYFHATRCADEGEPKPHPGMLLHLMKRLDVTPRETLMIGDTTHDLELARAGGVDAIGVAYGAHDTTLLASRGALAVVHSIGELRDWLAANG
ncbi:MAG TPA: HAD-IA family hydrolase [Casimicrobiaceae bacterium]|nr:HAD-IA family hydrolase [Casimicrobiaceae bacterium]